MKTKHIEFNAEDLVRSVEGFASHLTGKEKVTLRTRTLSLPPRVKAMTPAQVRAIRARLNVSQPVFAAMMNIPSITAASWERGRRKPTGAALRLLEIARQYPEVLMTGFSPGVNE
jgi:putative transcriptional regulator